MKLLNCLVFYAMTVSAVRATEAVLLSFGPSQTETARAGLSVRTISSSGFVLQEHGRSDLLIINEARTASQAHPAVSAETTSALIPSETPSDIKPVSPGKSLNSDLRLAGLPLRLSSSQMQRRQALAPLVAAVAHKHGLPHRLVDAVILAESKYEPFAVSHAGAAGMMQLMPGTAADLGVVNRFNAIANSVAGTRYLRQMINMMGSVRLGIAAYNAGPRSVRRAGGIPQNGETPAYVKRVLGFWHSMTAASAPVFTENQPAALVAGPAVQPRRQGIEYTTAEGSRLASFAAEVPHQSMDAAK